MPLDDPHIVVVDFLLLSIAVWRVTNLIVGEDGPWNIFGLLRKELIDPAKVDVPGSFSALLSCPYCLSPWLAIIASVSYALSRWPTLCVAFPIAMAGVTAFLQKLTYDRSVEIEGPSFEPPSAPPEPELPEPSDWLDEEAD